LADTRSAELDGLLRALAHPIRREILWLVWDQPLPAGAIAERFPVAGPTISEHLRVLRDAGLVEVHRRGTVRAYQARRDGLGPLAGMLAAGRVPPREPALPGEVGGNPRVHVSEGHVVSASVAVKAPIRLVFAHWTTPALMDSWLGTGSSCDPRDGGVFAFTSIHGLMVRGAYEAVLPPRLLIFEWDFDEAQVPIPSSELGQTVVTFSSRNDHTDVVITQIAYKPEAAQFLAPAWSDSLPRLAQAAEAHAIQRRRLRARATRSKGAST